MSGHTITTQDVLATLRDSRVLITSSVGQAGSKRLMFNVHKQNYVLIVNDQETAITSHAERAAQLYSEALPR